jgi:hypothetical protein
MFDNNDCSKIKHILVYILHNIWYNYYRRGDNNGKRREKTNEKRKNRWNGKH